MATDHHLPLSSNIRKNWRRQLCGKIMKLQKERQEMAQWNNVFKRIISQDLTSCSERLSKTFETLWELMVSKDEALLSGKAFSRDRTCSLQRKTTQTTWICLCPHEREGRYFLFVLARGRKQMAIRRYGGKKQALEGTLNVKKRLAIKTDSVQFIVWGKLKAGWAGQSRVSLDSCSLQLHCTHVVDSKYSANGAVRREGWEERTERCLKTHEWSNWWK